MSDANREIVESWFDQVWNQGDETAIDRLMSPTAEFHGLPSTDGVRIIGPAAFKPFFHSFRQAFPDIKVRVLQTVCEGNRVAAYCHVTGTHSGPGLGVAATGSAIDMKGMVFAEVRDGQVHEGWNCFDFMSLYQQVGMLGPVTTGG